jgi:hypothetical protein
MIVEEQLRKMRETKQVTTRSEIKNKIISLFMLAIASMCAVFGYKQQLEAKAQRDEVIKLHREIKRLNEESAAAHHEAAKWKNLMENERKKSAATLQQAQKRPKQ